MSRIAKGTLSDPLFKNKRSRRIAKGGGLGLRSGAVQLVLQRWIELGKPSTLVAEFIGVFAQERAPPLPDGVKTKTHSPAEA
jgi:hypothetical protein